MNLLVPLASVIGPVYLALHGSPVVWVLLWAIVWTSLRFAVERRAAMLVLNEPSDEPESWLGRLIERHPISSIAAAFAASLLVFTFIHVAVYWLVRSVVE